MQNEGIERVCCLLQTKQNQYNRLLEDYDQAFGEDCVCHTPVPDYDTVSGRVLRNDIVPFLEEADRMNSPVVVHCSAGMGRTGHVLALWLSAKRDYSLGEAIETVRKTGRSPLEATTKPALQSLLQAYQGH
jgi:protein-tyrosine phosphatase